MKKLIIANIIIASLAVGCSLAPPAQPEQPTPIELATILATIKPTAAPSIPTEIPRSLIAIEIERMQPKAGTVALDFVSLACAATWSSSIVFTACPGDENYLDDGIVQPLLSTTIESGEVFDTPSLLTIPPQANNKYGGIFGRYPAFTVQPGDRFRAVLTCQRSPCGEVEYALDTYDANGVFQPFPSNLYNPLSEYNHGGQHFVSIDLSLDYLAGQTVDFVLVVRDQSYLQGDRYLWVAPHIYRDPGNTSATPLPPIGGSSSATATSVEGGYDGSSDGIPGVIAGYVDMGSAPSHLSSTDPVVVVFFNLDDGTWWWIHTTQSHPSYQMTVSTGTYYILVYAKGSNGQAYVIAAYTGGAASCGANLAPLEVTSNAHLDNIIITDWCANNNWPPKPNEVPLP